MSDFSDRATPVGVSRQRPRRPRRGRRRRPWRASTRPRSRDPRPGRCRSPGAWRASRCARPTGELPGDRRGDLERPLAGRPRRDDLVDDPEVVRPRPPVSRRAVKIMLAARDQPTRRVSSCVPPPPGITPTLTSGQPDDGALPRDDEVAGQRDLEAAAEGDSRRPPRGLAPEAPAPRRMPPAPGGAGRTAAASVKVLRSLRSAPTQKARSWVLLTTTARTVSSAPSRLVASLMAAAMAVETAFIASGRSRTSSATWPPSPWRSGPGPSGAALRLLAGRPLP